MNKYNIDTSFNWERALERNFGDQELTWQIIELFCKLMPNDIELYRLYIENNDIEKLTEITHKIKSRLLFLNSTNLAIIFEEIELTIGDNYDVHALFEAEKLIKSYLGDVLKYKNDELCS